ncbi:MAG: hypothetical protein Q7S66_02920 [bacterium]|nr:hypothetical protein [bacterium]
MKKIVLLLLVTVLDSIIIIFLFVSLGFYFNKQTVKNIVVIPAVRADVPLVIQSFESEKLCDNENEVQDFSKPISIVWDAELSGCLVSCDGASFKRLSDDVKYSYFAGYGPAIKAIIESGELGDKNDVFWGSHVPIKVYGKWYSIDADHPRTVFDNKCVPIVDIEKIEKL